MSGMFQGSSPATRFNGWSEMRRSGRRDRGRSDGTVQSDRGDLLARLVAPIDASRHDFVIASRTLGLREPGSMHWHQLLAGRFCGAAIGLLTGTRYSDMCAYRAIRREALIALRLREMTYGWNIEMQMRAARAGLRNLEVPLPYRRRAGGTSKVAGSLSGAFRAGWRIVLTLIRVALSTAGETRDRPAPGRQ